MAAEVTGGSGALTDGTGVSPMTSTKVIKDLVFDFMLSAGAALGTDITFEALNLGDIIQGPEAAALGIAGAAIRTLARAIIRWTQTP